MSTCEIITGMLHVDINKLHVNIILLHADIIYLACRGQKMPLYYKIFLLVSFLSPLNFQLSAEIFLNLNPILKCAFRFPLFVYV